MKLESNIGGERERERERECSICIFNSAFIYVSPACAHTLSLSRILFLLLFRGENSSLSRPLKSVSVCSHYYYLKLGDSDSNP